MKEPTIKVRFDVDCVISVESVKEDRVVDIDIARITGEGIKFFTAWEGDDAFEAPAIWPSNFSALAKSLPAIVKVVDRAEDDLLSIQLRLNQGQATAQSDIDALNADS
jgi:hypothetical protein